MSRRHHRLDPRRWAATRRAVFKRDGWRCRCCGRAGRLEADHIRPLVDYTDQNPYALDGIQTLARGCHILKTRRESASRRRRAVPPAVAAWAALVTEAMEAT